MASMTELLPEPVAPVRANKSAPPKSTSVRSRNGANPTISSRSGLMGLLQQLVEEIHDRLVVSIDLGQILHEQIPVRATVATAPGSGMLAARRVEDHVDGLGDEVPGGVRQPGP